MLSRILPAIRASVPKAHNLQKVLCENWKLVCQHHVLTIRQINTSVPDNQTKIATLGNTSLEVDLAGKPSTTFDYVWLRENCRCPTCYEPKTFNKLIQVNEIDFKTKPKETKVSEKEMLIEWTDGHKSSYSLDWLKSNLYNPDYLKTKTTPTLWDGTLKPEDYPKVGFKKYMETKEGYVEALKLLLEKGFVFIEDVPANTEDTKKIVEKLGYFRHSMWAQGMHTVEYDPNNDFDSSFWNVPLIPHIDHCYFPEPAGLQMFHCFTLAENGGQTLLVDGFNAANEVRKRNPKNYDLLANTLIDYQWTDKAKHDHIFTTPILQLHPFNKELEQVRFNLLDIGPIRTVHQSEVRSFYGALVDLTNELFDDKNRIQLLLKPGLVLIVDNFRVLHGRTGFKGSRLLCSAYIGRPDWRSNARINGLL